MKHFYIFMIVTIITYQFGYSQDSLGIDISGSVDVYYRYNIQADFDSAPATSFANLPGFSLGMVNLKIAKEVKSVGFMADLALGPRGEDATFLSPLLRPGGSSGIINQMYTYWQVSDEFKITLGNYNTFLGYEVISPVDNFNYSTSYLFSYGPFSHTGVKFDYTSTGGFTCMVGFFNPTDATEYNPSNDYTLGAQIGYVLEKGSVYFNTIFSEDFYQFDITAGVDVSKDIYVGLNASTVKDGYSGAAAYLKVAVKTQLSIGSRLEYFKDEGIGLFGLNESVVNLSLSANYTIGNLILIPELRLDKNSEEIYSDDTEMKNTISSLILGAVYEF